MRVAVTDYNFPDLDIEKGILEPAGHEVIAWKEKRSAAELPQLVTDADAILTQFAPMNAEVIASVKQARVIVRYGIGVDNVDLDAAKAKNIPVCNVPEYCIDEVADHTLAFILAITRQVIPNCLRLREGRWGLASAVHEMRALRDLSVGVVGFGRIGRQVVERLRAFKCRILVHDPGVAAAEIESAGCVPVDLSELLSQSDVVTLHCPSTASTRNMISREAIAMVRPGAILVNVARGDIVDLSALTEALQSGRISAAALDVFAPEPLPREHPILKMPNVVVASHIASVSEPAVRKLRETAAKLVAQALGGQPLQNVVNGVVIRP